MSSSARLAATVLLLIAGCHRAEPVPKGAVRAGGVTLTPVSIELPSDDRDLPEAPGANAVRQNCTACHSTAMILSQPPLRREQWQAEVEKMQKAYHAPVDPAAVPAIVGYLERLSVASNPPPQGEGDRAPQARGGGVSSSR